MLLKTKEVDLERTQKRTQIEAILGSKPIGVKRHVVENKEKLQLSKETPFGVEAICGERSQFVFPVPDSGAGQVGPPLGSAWPMQAPPAGVDALTGLDLLRCRPGRGKPRPYIGDYEVRDAE
jgi:hypothetical protein